jgi:O6-methylguanine-DNA--protein-cysteine methyltransferase
MAKNKKVVITTTTTKAVKPVKESKKKVTTTVVTTTVTEEIVGNERTHIICVLDRSGSMGSIIGDSIGGFNEFLKQQKALPGEATITVHLFDDKHDCIYDYVDIKNAQELTRAVWYPRGTTALYDAIGRAINKDKARFVGMGKEAPSKVLVCVVTDGLENASTEFRKEDIQKLIKGCEVDDWNFIYLAANQNAFAVGTSFGISGGNTITYTANSVGVAGMSATLNCVATSYRGMSSKSADFKTRSKSLIDNQDDDKNPQDFNSGTITTNGNTGAAFTTNNVVVDTTKK